MTMTIPASETTPDELLLLPNSVRYELVDGKLLERNLGFESSEIAARILGLIWVFLSDHPLGKIFGADASYQCFPNSVKKVRRPDVSFIRAGRLPPKTPKGHCPIHPDLAVEVVSPGDTADEVEEKVREYL